MNDWISPWPGYGTGQMSECINKEEMVVCVVNMGMGNNGQTNIVMERVLVNLTEPTESKVLIGFYDSNNQRVGETVSALKQIVIAGDEMKTYEVTNGSVSLSLLLNEKQTITPATNTTNLTITTTYQGLIADPLLIESTFTKLFFLEGKGMKHFEKFSDVTDITGVRIIVWKVNWE